VILSHKGLAPTPTDLEPAEKNLVDDVGGLSVFWSGRAATALHWAYRISEQRCGDRVEVPEVIIPAVACATPATCALAAGWRPRFADIDPETGMSTLDTIRERWTPATRAVVFIDLYGQTADLTPLSEWCTRHDVTLIEDVAQAQSARFPSGSLAGSIGDLVVYSFNRTKILECGGGALVLRTQRAVEAFQDIVHRESGPAEIEPESLKSLALSQRNLYHSLVDLRRLGAATDVSRAFRAVDRAYDPLYVRPMESPRAVAAAWPELSQAVASRYRKAERYSSLLRNGPWKLLDGWRTSGVCWRYSLLVDFPSELARFTELVRSDGFYVSNLYWPLNDLIDPLDKCPHAESFARRVLNLWVDHTVDLNWIERCAASLCSHSNRLQLEPQLPVGPPAV
jgi:dTDP-4-amino-4,6-dideoxygalactose transaminase